MGTHAFSWCCFKGKYNWAMVDVWIVLQKKVDIIWEILLGNHDVLDILQWHSILSAEILPEEEELKFTDQNAWPLKYGLKNIFLFWCDIFITINQELHSMRSYCLTLFC